MAEDDDEAPIEARDYLVAQVVDLEGVRIARGMAVRRPRGMGECSHMRLTYDLAERRVWCEDCERTVPAFDAFMVFVEKWTRIIGALKRREDAVKAAEAHSLISRAAKAIDDVWRGRRQTPCCPHCHEALLPQDFASGRFATRSRELEIQRRARNRKEPT